MKREHFAPFFITMKSKQLLIVGSVWPEPSSSAAGTRMLQLISVFQKMGFAVTFASAAANSEYSVDLKSMDVDKANIQINNASFDSFLKELEPQIVMFDRFMTEEQFGWRVAENCPDALRILDTEDLHCLRAARHLAWKKKREFNTDDLYLDVAKREIASIYRCDVSLIISSYEMELLKQHFKVNESLLHYVPFMAEPVDTIKWKSYEERRDFVSIGNFLHEPNWNSVQFLKEEIWPLIRKQLPEAQLKVYGAYPSQKVNALNNPKEGFLIMGKANDAKKEIISARVLLAPLRFGAGLKGKLIDAMMYGTPNVTTSIGAEGMHSEFEWSGIIANTSVEIAQAAVKLYSDRSLWKHSVDNGKRIIDKFFNREPIENALVAKISETVKNISSHRKKNFIGAMLMHHTISGTKYMSKWIEEKNK